MTRQRCSIDFTNAQMTIPQRLVRDVERSFGFLGVILLISFVGAMICRDVTLQQGLRDFDKSQLVMIPSPRELFEGDGDGERVDVRLWSQQRIQAYRASLGVTKNVPLAVLRLDRFKTRVPVYEGTDDLALNRGAGWIIGTARPGETGNVGIACHRDGAFRALKDIAIGDVIELTTTGAKATYAVDQIEIVYPENVGVLLPRPLPSITLTTCYPFYFMGDAPQRFIVHAALRQQINNQQIYQQRPESERSVQLNNKERKQ